jgi:predicted nuclease of predicted toxin-antitoxin system
LRFLIDASLPRSSADLARRRGHEAIDVRDIGLGASSDSIIAQHAKRERVTLVSADFDFADIRFYPPADYYGIVVIDREEDSTVADTLSIFDRLLSDATVLAALPGRLAIVDIRRIRLRPAMPQDIG